MPSTIYLDSLLRARGVANESKVILYYGGERFAATYRLYFTFDYLGISENVFILDSGLKTWMDADLPVSSEKPQVNGLEAGTLSIKPNKSLIASNEQVQNFVGHLM